MSNFRETINYVKMIFYMINDLSFWLAYDSWIAYSRLICENIVTDSLNSPWIVTFYKFSCLQVYNNAYRPINHYICYKYISCAYK